jgi:hypothetical protein
MDGLRSVKFNNFKRFASRAIAPPGEYVAGDFLGGLI